MAGTVHKIKTVKLIEPYRGRGGRVQQGIGSEVFSQERNTLADAQTALPFDQVHFVVDLDHGVHQLVRHLQVLQHV